MLRLKIFIILFFILNLSSLKVNAKAIDFIIKKGIYNNENKLETYTSYDYNKKGNWIKEQYYTIDGIKDNYIIYEYDELNRLKKYIFYNKKGDITSIENFNYDKANKIITIQLYGSKNQLLNTIYKKYLNDLLIEMKQFKYNDKQNEEITYYKYSGNNSTIIEKYNLKNELIGVMEFQFNSNNNLIKILNKDKNNNIEFQIIFLYDDKGNFIRQEDRYGDGKISEYYLFYYNSFDIQDNDAETIIKNRYPISSPNVNDFLKDYKKIF